MDVHEDDTEKQGNTAIQMRESQSVGRRMFIVALIIQVLLTALCLAINMYSLQFNRTVQPVRQEIGIYLEMAGEVRGTVEKLKLEVRWKHKMEIKGNTTIIFPCSGTYFFQLFVCSVDISEQKGNRTLILQQGREDLMVIPLLSKNPCEQIEYGIRTFTNNNNVSIKFSSTSDILKYLRLGFRYMWGEECF